jgi:hypothetical protein
MPIMNTKSYPWKSYRFVLVIAGRFVMVETVESLPGGVLRVTRSHSPDMPQIAAEFLEAKEVTIQFAPQRNGEPGLLFVFDVLEIDALPINCDSMVNDHAKDRVDIRVRQVHRVVVPPEVAGFPEGAKPSGLKSIAE